MKKFMILAGIFTLVLAACENNDTSNKFGEIGQTGPGGGMIFFAEGGQYKECSGELGDATWAAAVTTAKNYNTLVVALDDTTETPKTIQAIATSTP